MVPCTPMCVRRADFKPFARDALPQACILCTHNARVRTRKCFSKLRVGAEHPLSSFNSQPALPPFIFSCPQPACIGISKMLRLTRPAPHTHARACPVLGTCLGLAHCALRQASLQLQDPQRSSWVLRAVTMILVPSLLTGAGMLDGAPGGPGPGWNA